MHGLMWQYNLHLSQQVCNEMPISFACVAGLYSSIRFPLGAVNDDAWLHVHACSLAWSDGRYTHATQTDIDILSQ